MLIARCVQDGGKGEGWMNNVLLAVKSSIKVGLRASIVLIPKDLNDMCYYDRFMICFEYWTGQLRA